MDGSRSTIFPIDEYCRVFNAIDCINTRPSYLIVATCDLLQLPELKERLVAARGAAAITV
jgi:hypothetical protein